MRLKQWMALVLVSAWWSCCWWLALVLCLCGVAFQLLLGEARQGGALAQRLMLRRLQRRTLQLIKGDLADATRWQLQPDPQPDWPCPMAHRDGADRHPPSPWLGTGAVQPWHGSIVDLARPGADALWPGL
jgi:hypothetical protein